MIKIEGNDFDVMEEIENGDEELIMFNNMR